MTTAIPTSDTISGQPNNAWLLMFLNPNADTPLMETYQNLRSDLRSGLLASTAVRVTDVQVSGSNLVVTRANAGDHTDTLPSGGGGGTTVAPHTGAAGDTDLTGITIGNTDYEIVDTVARADAQAAGQRSNQNLVSIGNIGLDLTGQVLTLLKNGNGQAAVTLPSSGGGGDTTVAGLSLELIGTSATLTGTAANIPHADTGNVTREDLSDVFLVDMSYTRTNSDLRMSAIVMKAALAGTVEYRLQLQGSGGDYVALQFDAATDAANLTAEDEASGVSDIVVRIYNTQPAPASGGGSVTFGDATEADTASGSGGSSTDAARDDHSHAQSALYGTIGYDDEGIFEWSGTDAGMIAQLQLDDTNSAGRFPTSAKRYFTNSSSVFHGKVARRNATAISHSSSTHTVADYFEVMDWGSASGGGGPTITWLRPSNAQDVTSGSRPAGTVWAVGADMRTALGNISSPSDGDQAFAYLLRTTTTDFALFWIYSNSRWQLVSESNVDPYRSGSTIPISGEGILDDTGIAVWDSTVIYPVNYVVIHNIAGNQGWQMYRKRTDTQTRATQPNPQVTADWDRLTNAFGADLIQTDTRVPGSSYDQSVQGWIDYFGSDVPSHQAYWSEGAANNAYVAPDSFEVLVADLTALGTLRHGDTLLIEMSNSIPDTASAHLNLQYKNSGSQSNTLTSANIPVADGHQVIAFDIRYLDTAEEREVLDIDAAITGTGSGALKVDSIVHFDGTLAAKDKEVIGSIVGLMEERLEAIERFRGLWNGRSAYFQGQMVIHNLNLYICIRDVPARPSPQSPNDGPRVSTTYWEAVSAYQGEWQSGHWYGAGNTFLYTLNADQYNEEQQLYLVVDRIDSSTSATVPPNNPNVVRIDTAGAIARIADWAKTGNVSEIPAAKLPQVQITRRNARMVVNYDGADVSNEFQFPQASPTLDGAMSAADKEKLNTIQENAQRHIQTDWAADPATPAGVLNRPALAPSNAEPNRSFVEIATGLNALMQADRISYNSLRNRPNIGLTLRRSANHALSQWNSSNWWRIGTAEVDDIPADAMFTIELVHSGEQPQRFQFQRWPGTAMIQIASTNPASDGWPALMSNWGVSNLEGDDVHVRLGRDGSGNLYMARGSGESFVLSSSVTVRLDWME